MAARLGECSRAEAEGATLRLRYTAMDVNLVMAPRAGSSAKAAISLADGQQAGADVTREGERSIVTVQGPRMYNLVANDSVRQGSLELKALEPGLAIYAFTFTSCIVAD